jgi:hypothetical protein
MTEKRVFRTYSREEVSAIMNTRQEASSHDRSFNPKGLNASAIFAQRRAQTEPGPGAQTKSHPSVTSASFAQNVFAARRSMTVVKSESSASATMSHEHQRSQSLTNELSDDPSANAGTLDAAIERAVAPLSA